MRAVLVAMCVFFGFSVAAAAQSFQVRPLIVEGDVNPGTIVEIPILVAPTTLLEAEAIDVQIVQLAQTSSGAFIAIEDVPGAATPRSSAAWITAPDSIILDPPDVTTLTVTMDVPISATGSYAAGILLSIEPPEDAVGLRVTVRLLVPIIVTTAGRVARQDVRMADASLRYQFLEQDIAVDGNTEPDAEPVGTFVDAIIANNGGTFSRFRGNVWVDAATDGGDWRQVRRVEIGETRLLPETVITLPVSLGRLLPGGDYRIRGELYVDGRRTSPLTREVAFEGHPAVEGLLTDITLPVEPSVFEYSYAPGATRSGLITIENPAISPIEVSLSVALPEGMEGRASAAMRDTDISAVDWITVTPETFLLRPGQARNVRLLAVFPDADAAQQNYFAEITADAHYLDGQRAGSATGLVEVSRPDAVNVPALELTQLQVAATEAPATYGLSLRATNTGNMRLSPEISFLVVDAAGEAVSRGTLESDIETPLLPLEERAYGSAVNFGDLPPADYVLLITVNHAGERLSDARMSVSLDASGELDVRATE